MQIEHTPRGLLESWTLQEVSQAFGDNQIVLIDVRTPQEYTLEHIKGALLMPLADFAPEKLPAQDNKRLVLHCGSGARSREAAIKALEAGVTCIAHLEGGLQAWKEAGRPYISLHRPTHQPREVSAN
jgi:rhodanese-related sulfurtransferase